MDSEYALKITHLKKGITYVSYELIDRLFES